MARMRTDADRSAVLSALLDQAMPDDEGNTPAGPQVVRMPEGAPNQEAITNSMGGPNQGGGDPTIPPTPMQQAPGQQGMIAVPAALAHAGMQALMAQASGGRSLGADGQIASLPPDDSFIPGNDPERATDSEVEEEEENNAKRKKSGPVRRRS